MIPLLPNRSIAISLVSLRSQLLPKHDSHDNSRLFPQGESSSFVEEHSLPPLPEPIRVELPLLSPRRRLPLVLRFLSVSRTGEANPRTII